MKKIYNSAVLWLRFRALPTCKKVAQLPKRAIRWLVCYFAPTYVLTTFDGEEADTVSKALEQALHRPVNLIIIPHTSTLTRLT